MTDKLLRIKSVMDRTGKSRSAIYADIANGCFPKSIAIGARSVAWAESAIVAWIKSKIDAAKPKPTLKPMLKSSQEWANELEKSLKKEALEPRKPGELRACDI